MDLEKLMLMRDLKAYDKWVLENTYDGPIPIEVIKNKLASYERDKDNDWSTIRFYI